MSEKGLNEEQGQALLWLAREVISVQLGSAGRAQPDWVGARLADQAVQQKGGVFVTLKKRGQLRGCIGSLAAAEPIAAGVRRNAINAAFSDPRFRPLSPDELGGLTVEVSVLSEPRALAFSDAAHLLAILRPGVDGLIIRKGAHSATFLPQVWEQLPKAEDFLSHLCRKAGLPADAWLGGGLEVFTYEAQYFEEEGD